MMFKTHLMATVFFIFLFLPKVESKFVFALVTLFASFLPDLDTKFSKYGKNKSFRIMQFFFKHRTFFHSLTFVFIVSFLLALFFPKIAFAFFLGYSLHIILDSFTLEGIFPFWPIKEKIKGNIKTGGFFEKIFFKVLIIINFLIVLFFLLNKF